MVVLGLLVIAGLVATLIWVPKIEVYGLYQVRHPQKISPAFYKRDVFTQEDRARQTLVTMIATLATTIGGLFVAFGAYTTWQNLQLSRQVAEKNAETAQKNIEIAEDKLITDRFTAAVTNLSAEGTDKMAQRLGGIYALERIVRDSPEDHWTVMEVLTAYVRDKRPIRENPAPKADGGLPDAPQVVRTAPPTDIQAILTVIGRCGVDEGRTLDLHKVDLFQANLRGANLRGANLRGANLRGANLSGANLSGANLMGADLSGATLTRAALARATLGEAYLGGATLGRTYLGGATLAGCLDLTQEQLDSADYHQAPASLPPGLHFPAQPASDPTTVPTPDLPALPPA